ncbi:MAG: dienelactone hydrolase family protein [Acidobacteria bacterium]|nr:dienelactone hydrolase family protein [Acidobacteriota bacterium]
MAQITFTRPDGQDCSGFYVEPDAGSRAPGLVVIQEWWGLNDQIKGVAQRFASRGYRVLVPDLYRGKVGLDAKEAEHLMGNLNFADAAGQDIRGAVQHLKQTGAKVGVTGFCMGGALTLLSAVFVSEADAAAVWYGFPPLEYIDASRITMPLLGHFATEDQFFPIAQVDELEKKLKAAGVRYTFHRYNAQHAFANEENVDKPLPIKYDATAAETAWQRTLDFFGQHLGVAQHA